MSNSLATYFNGGAKANRSYIWAALATLYSLGCALYTGCSDALYLVLASVNAAVCSAMIFAPGAAPISLNKIVNLFILLFFVVANSIQFATDNLVISFYLPISRHDYIILQTATCIGLILFNTIYLAVYLPWSRRARHTDLCKRVSPERVNFKLLVTVSAVAALVTLALSGFDPTTLFSRGAWQQYADASPILGYKSVTLLFQSFLRPIPAFCLLIGVISNQRLKKLAILLLLALFADFPTAIPRSLAAAMWLPSIIFLAEKYMSRNFAMLCIIAGILIVFPMLSSFRYTDEGMKKTAYGIESFNTITYDASQMAMAAVKTDSVTCGRQLAGAVGFFVPRRIWKDKPEGSGHLIANIHRSHYSNVAMPWPGEGYVNFGWPGVAIFTLALALITARADALFRPSGKVCRRNILPEGCYLISASLLLFIMRGSLMASLSMLVGTLLSFTLCCLLSVRRANQKNA